MAETPALRWPPEWVVMSQDGLICRHCHGRDRVATLLTIASYQHAPDCLIPLAEAAEEAARVDACT